MPFVQEVIVNDTPLSAGSWDTIRAELLALKSKPHTTLFLGGAKGQMILEFVQNIGYYVSAFAEGETEEWLVVEDGLSDDWIKVDVSGHLDKIPRRILVSDDVAVDVAREFYRSGRRLHGQSWLRSVDLMRES